MATGTCKRCHRSIGKENGQCGDWIASGKECQRLELRRLRIREQQVQEVVFPSLLRRDACGDLAREINELFEVPDAKKP